MAHEVIVHKVVSGDNLDNIIFSTYNIPSESHLYGLRNYIYSLNSSHSNCRVSHDGKTIYQQPNSNEFFLLPSESELHRRDFYMKDKIDPTIFSEYGRNRHIISTLLDDSSQRSSMLKFQEKVTPVEAISYFEMVDGMCAILANEKERKWCEHFKDYAGETFQEAGSKFADRGAEVYLSIKKLDTLAIAYGSSKEMKVRQTLKPQIKEAQAEVQKNFSKTLNKYIKSNAHKTHTKAIYSTNKLLKSMDNQSGKVRSVILKADFDRYLKYTKYAKYAGDALTGYAFVDAQLDALKAKKSGKDWQKELFVKDAGVLGMIVVANIVILTLPAEIPIIIGAAVVAGAAYATVQGLEYISEKAYDKWLE